MADVQPAKYCSDGGAAQGFLVDTQPSGDLKAIIKKTPSIKWVWNKKSNIVKKKKKIEPRPSVVPDQTLLPANAVERDAIALSLGYRPLLFQ